MSQIIRDIRGFKYSPQTGNVYRNPGACIGTTLKPGPILNKKTSHGYLECSIGGVRTYLHRLAVMLMTKAPIPKGLEVDHIDGDRSNNTWSNLHIVLPRKNQRNRKEHRNGRLVGSTPRGNKFGAQIQVNGKKLHLGTFDTEIEAHKAYMEFATKNVPVAQVATYNWKQIARFEKIEAAAKKLFKNHHDIAREWCRECDKDGLMCVDQLEEALEAK